MRISSICLKNIFLFILKKTNYPLVTKAFISGLLFFFLINKKVHAQSKDSANRQIPKASIALKDGAMLYSTDSAFNRQISANKIINEKAAVSYQKDKNGNKTLEMLTPKTDSAKAPENSAVFTGKKPKTKISQKKTKTK